MTSKTYWPGTSPQEIEGTAGRLYGPLKATICAVEAQAKAYEAAHDTNITDNLSAWRKATGRRSEALFLKWQATRRRSDWDAYRYSEAGLKNYGAW